jgi:hypothetical protein
MAEPTTKVNEASMADFLNAIPQAQVREDCWTIAEIMQAATDDKPKMWGTNIVGFGRHRTVYAKGKEADWMLIAFAPRKQNITLYGLIGFEGHEELLARLGKHSCGKGCLYIKRLSDIDLPTLKELVQASVQHKTKTNPQAS